MSPRLSGILDLVKASHGQNSLYAKEKWGKIYSYYAHKYRLVLGGVSISLEEK